MKEREILFKKTIMFHDCENVQQLVFKQDEYLQAFELLRLNYEIKRTSQYGTQTPTWEVTVYK